MSRKQKNIFFWLSAVLVSIGLVIITWLLLNNGVTALEIIGWITGAVFPALAFLYSIVQKRSLRLFLFSQRVKGFISSKPMVWNLSATFRGDNITEQTLEVIIKKLNSHWGKKDQLKVVKLDPHARQVVIPFGPTLDISYIRSSPSLMEEMMADEPASIHVVIRNYRVGYRGTLDALQKEIIPVLENISSVVSAVASKYTFTIEFDKNRNPFFGLYIAHFDPEIISQFFIRLTINEYEPNDTVLISEGKIAINAYSQSALQNLAREFLTFDFELEERLSSG